jgi:hypothetical protein
MEHKIIMTVDDWHKLRKAGYYKLQDKGCTIRFEIIEATNKEAEGEDDEEPD